MTNTELIERLTQQIKEMAEIIKDQQQELEQLREAETMFENED